MVEQVEGNIYRFPITLPRSPLKYLNCYVIKGEDGKNLLLDTGYHVPDSIADLDAGMRELDLRPDNTDVFITHVHADHAGNGRYLSERGFRILMGERDHDGVVRCHQPGFYGARQKAADAGVPEDVFDAMFVHNPTPIMMPEFFEAELVHDGDILRYGGRRLRALACYGHSPGHMCLWDEENAVLFLGDHVLFDITPNVVIWTWEDDALGSYLESLRMVRQLPVRLALPAHRTVGSVALPERIDELLLHHEARLHEIEEIVRAESDLSAYVIASRMKWSIHAPNWDAFPATQKYFAVCECMAHLQHMLLTGRLVCRTDASGAARYSPGGAKDPA